jgi:protein-tyrosine phosphatase
MIDLHTHLLPGVDDGSHTIEQSVEVLQRFAAEGVKTVCCTPHLRASQLAKAPADQMDALLGDLVDAAPPLPELCRGFEIMLDMPTPRFTDRRCTLAGTRYVLVEYGRMVPVEASVEVLGRIVAQGLTPVLAHPERYAVCTPELARRWQQVGAVLQLDATTLLGDSRRAARARALLEAGCGSLVASDNHGDTRSVVAAVGWLSSRGGGAQAELMAIDNPQAILNDEPVRPVPPFRLRRSAYTRLKDFLIGGAEV